ncbi:MAG: hypothetical protein II429_08700 [Prevotella sp.]|nr:hypothetical protein [Prevotella sp.]
MMNIIKRTIKGLVRVLPFYLFTFLPLTSVAQDIDPAPLDSIAILEAKVDSMLAADSALTALPEELQPVIANDTVKVKVPRDWASWKPNPQKALWLALVLPGAGQIYNRKYWKLPIVYGGFVGCIYAMTWNDMMYKDYSQAYLDIMDDDPGTQSYNKFLHLGQQIDSSNAQQVKQYSEIFKKRKDKFRRWRDLSFFVMVGVYALSVIDAYVDAELSQFDISKDLSLRVAPAVINNNSSSNPLESSSFGVNCSLNF